MAEEGNNIQIDVAQVVRAKPQSFYVDVVVDNQVLRLVMKALNLESLAAELNYVAAANTPRITGWNIFDTEGKLVMSVSAMDRLSLMSQQTPLGKNPGDKAAAGWRAIPVVTPMSDEFQKMLDQAKREGRVVK